MKKIFSLFFLVCTVLFVGTAQAQVTIIDAWANPTVAGQTTGAVYLTLKSDQPARLVQVSSSAAETAQLHEMKMNGDVMTMRDLKAIDLPAGKSVSFKDEGYHVMLLHLVKPLQIGDKLPLSITIETKDGKRDTMNLSVEVRKQDDNDMSM